MELVEGTALLYADYSMRKPEIARAMTKCWVSGVWYLLGEPSAF
jgi:hypothetical protein